MTQACYRCGIVLSHQGFYKSPTTGKLTNECRRCLKERARDRYNSLKDDPVERERIRLARQRDAEKKKIYMREWLSKNKGARRLTNNAAARTYSARVKQEVIDAYGGPICSCCGETVGLTIDHVNSDGNVHRKMLGSGDKTKTSSFQVYAWIKRNGFPKGMFRVLCHTCNAARARNKITTGDDRCPHEIELLQLIDIAAFSARKAA